MGLWPLRQDNNSWEVRRVKNIFRSTSFLFLVGGLLLVYGCFGLSFSIGDPPENHNHERIAEEKARGRLKGAASDHGLQVSGRAKPSQKVSLNPINTESSE